MEQPIARRTKLDKFVTAVALLTDLNLDYEISVTRRQLGVDRDTLGRALDNAINIPMIRADLAKRPRRNAARKRRQN